MSRYFFSQIIFLLVHLFPRKKVMINLYEVEMRGTRSKQIFQNVFLSTGRFEPTISFDYKAFVRDRDIWLFYSEMYTHPPLAIKLK